MQCATEIRILYTLLWQMLGQERGNGQEQEGLILCVHFKKKKVGEPFRIVELFVGLRSNLLSHKNK